MAIKPKYEIKNLFGTGDLITSSSMNDLIDASYNPTIIAGDNITISTLNTPSGSEITISSSGGGGGGGQMTPAEVRAAVEAADNSNVFTDANLTKLNGIEALADVTDAANVTTALASISVTALSDVTAAGSGSIISGDERTKLTGIEAGADVTDAANVTTALNSISVTELNDVTAAGSGSIITTGERTKLSGIDTGANDYSFDITVDGGTAETIDNNDTVDFISGNGITISRSGADVTVKTVSDTHQRYTIGNEDLVFLTHQDFHFLDISSASGGLPATLVDGAVQRSSTQISTMLVTGGEEDTLYASYVIPAGFNVTRVGVFGDNNEKTFTVKTSNVTGSSATAAFDSAKAILTSTPTTFAAFKSAAHATGGETSTVPSAPFPTGGETTINANYINIQCPNPGLIYGAVIHLTRIT